MILLRARFSAIILFYLARCIQTLVGLPSFCCSFVLFTPLPTGCAVFLSSLLTPTRRDWDWRVQRTAIPPPSVGLANVLGSETRDLWSIRTYMCLYSATRFGRAQQKEKTKRTCVAPRRGLEEQPRFHGGSVLVRVTHDLATSKSAPRAPNRNRRKRLRGSRTRPVRPRRSRAPWCPISPPAGHA